MQRLPQLGSTFWLPPWGEAEIRRLCLLIRVIRVIRGSNCGFQVQVNCRFQVKSLAGFRLRRAKPHSSATKKETGRGLPVSVS